MKDERPLDWDVLRDDVAAFEQSAAPGTEVVRKARARFLLTAQRRPVLAKTSRAPMLWAAVALAASVALGTVGWMRYRTQAPVSLDTGNEHASGPVGALLAARGPLPLPAHFSSGTILSIASSI